MELPIDFKDKRLCNQKKKHDTLFDSDVSTCTYTLGTEQSSDIACNPPQTHDKESHYVYKEEHEVDYMKAGTTRDLSLTVGPPDGTESWFSPTKA